MYASGQYYTPSYSSYYDHNRSYRSERLLESGLLPTIPEMEPVAPSSSQPPPPPPPPPSQPLNPNPSSHGQDNKFLLMSLLTVVNMLSITICVLVPGLIDLDAHEVLGRAGLALVVYFLVLLSYVMASMILFFLVQRSQLIWQVEMSWMPLLTLPGLAVYYLFLQQNIVANLVLGGIPAALTFAANVFIVSALFDPVRAIKRAIEQICA